MRIQEFDFSVDLLQAILWQYNDATKLQSLLRQKSDWYVENQTAFWTDWVNNVFNLKTANDFGCAVWGVILGIPLSLSQPGSGNRPVWGFGPNNLNFGNGNFGRESSGVAGLTLEQKRLVLRLRYFQLITDGTVPHINFILRDVFGQGYVVDNHDMTMTYVFQTEPSAQVRAVLAQFDLLPRPAGVGTNIVILTDPVWGFGVENQNFENGPFGA